MKFEQPRLPYAPDALEGTISQLTISFHYGKHEKAYIDNLNNLIKDTPYADMSMEDIIKNSDGAIFNNATQAWNHIFYFFQFSPVAVTEPSGKLLEQIERDFGSFDDFKTAFEEKGKSLFGSGWVWLSVNENNKLVITTTQNGGNPMTDNLRPLLTFDVWEHAYYLDYQNLRADYLKRLWSIVDWDIIAERYE